MTERKTGLDFLRMFLMVMVAILHVLTNGGVLENTRWMSGQYLTAWYLEILSFCAVDCFALISGYVSSQAKFRWSRVLELWVQIVFYTLLTTLLFALFLPGSVGELAWFGAIFPITSGQYWFMTAYVGMFFFMPLLNLVLAKASRRMLTELMIVLLIFFSFLPCLFAMALKEPPYGLNSGYSMIWLMILYLVGGYIRKYNLTEKLSRKGAVLLFLGSTTLAWLSKVVIERGTNALLGYPTAGKSFTGYISPLIVANAIALLCFFARTEFRSKGMRRLIALLAPAALGVYVIHVQPLIWNHIIRNCAAGFATQPPVVMVLCVIGLAFGIYLVCSLIDVVRLRLFRALQVPKLCRKLDGFVARLPLKEG